VSLPPPPPPPPPPPEGKEEKRAEPDVAAAENSSGECDRAARLEERDTLAYFLFHYPQEIPPRLLLDIWRLEPRLVATAFSCAPIRRALVRLHDPSSSLVTESPTALPAAVAARRATVALEAYERSKLGDARFFALYFAAVAPPLSPEGEDDADDRSSGISGAPSLSSEPRTGTDEKGDGAFGGDGGRERPKRTRGVVDTAAAAVDPRGPIDMSATYAEEQADDSGAGTSLGGYSQAQADNFLRGLLYHKSAPGDARPERLRALLAQIDPLLDRVLDDGALAYGRHTQTVHLGVFETLVDYAAERELLHKITQSSVQWGVLTPPTPAALGRLAALMTRHPTAFSGSDVANGIDGGASADESSAGDSDDDSDDEDDDVKDGDENDDGEFPGLAAAIRSSRPSSSPLPMPSVTARTRRPPAPPRRQEPLMMSGFFARKTRVPGPIRGSGARGAAARNRNIRPPLYPYASRYETPTRYVPLPVPPPSSVHGVRARTAPRRMPPMPTPMMTRPSRPPSSWLPMSRAESAAGPRHYRGLT
jgi:hypothetical protein